MKKLKSNQGITLIALIITIIVMLILVGVSISIALNTGLFDSAGKATQDYKTAQEAEQELGSGKVNISGTTYENIDDYEAEVQKEKITFYILHSFDTLEYTVTKGTTWEQFLSENQVPYFTEDGITYYLPFTTENIMPGEFPDGLLYLVAAGPVIELGGTWTEGPWVHPTDPIKDGITYDCEM